MWRTALQRMEVAVEGAAGVGNEAGRDTEANAVDLRGFQAKAIVVHRVTGLISELGISCSILKLSFSDSQINAMLLRNDDVYPWLSG